MFRDTVNNGYVDSDTLLAIECQDKNPYGEGILRAEEDYEHFRDEEVEMTLKIDKLNTRECYPCFDSSDYATKIRLYQNYLILIKI